MYSNGRNFGNKQYRTAGRYTDRSSITGYSNCGCGVKKPSNTRAITGYSNYGCGVKNPGQSNVGYGQSNGNQGFVGNVQSAWNELVDNPDPRQGFVENLGDVWGQLTGQQSGYASPRRY